MSIREQLREFVVANFYVADPSDLRDDESLLERGIVDSTGILEVISFLEESFGIEVADKEMTPENLDSIERLAVFVARKVARPAEDVAA